MTGVVWGVTLPLPQHLAGVWKMGGVSLAHSRWQGQDENGDISPGSEPAQIGRGTSVP